MIWEYGKGDQRIWMFANDCFTKEELRKNEVNMCLGNGYMCIRSAEDEYIPGRSSRLELISGMFNMNPEGLPILQNMPDMTNIVFTADGEDIRPMPLDEGEVATNYSDYLKALNMHDGKMTRSFVWTTKTGKKLKMEFERIVPLDKLHLYSARVTVSALKGDMTMTARAGIINETPDQCRHWCRDDESPYFTGEDYIGYLIWTHQSHIDVATAVRATLKVNGKEMTEGGCAMNDMNEILQHFHFELKEGETAVFEKFGCVYTSRDLECEGMDPKDIMAKCGKEVASCGTFEELYQDSRNAWYQLWEDKDVVIDADWEFEQQALRYAIWNLTITDPRHDGRMNIGARGIQGTGYNNHIFWDTEVYMLPFFIFSEPDAARKLMEFRYHSIGGARRKAERMGFRGAMYPWEAAWITDEECTPTWCATGTNELHITGDVAQAIRYYVECTDDQQFMEDYGYEMIFDIATFWCTRSCYVEKNDRYEILDVIGPDEAREHTDNNAYTNYIAHLSLDYAIMYYDRLKKENPKKLEELRAHIATVDEDRALWEKVLSKMYLPKENADGIVPQDDKYLEDAKPYIKESKKTGERHGMSKQADVMVLFILFEDMFGPDVKIKNYYYYEPLCTHGSSLSRSSYSLLAADVGDKDAAYQMYQDAHQMDLGAKQQCSDGIHTAGAGGLWQCAVLGFMGVRLYGSDLRIQPNLPDKWRKAETNIWFHNVKLHLYVDHDKFTVTRLQGNNELSFLYHGKRIELNDAVTVTLDK